jgi:hypothetical protein
VQTRLGVKLIGATLLAVTALGCPSSRPGAKDAGADAGRKDGGVVTTGGGAAATGSGAGGNGNGSGGSGGSGASHADGGTAGGGGSGPRDAGVDSGAAPIHLDGTWSDNGRAVVILQDGSGVTGTYHTALVCDLDNGAQPPGTMPAPGANVETTTEDFTATLSNGPDVHVGDTLTGSITTCRHGYEPDSGVRNGIVYADLKMTVTDANTLSGEWQADSDGDGKIDTKAAILITRKQ